MDFLTLEKSKGGFQHILVVTDHFTRLAHAIPTRNMTAKTTAEALYNNFITYYGIPSRIHSDQGANFERQERDVRRSTRTRKQPAWLRSGEYINTIQQKQTKDLEWKQGEKLKYLQSMLLTGTCKGFENKIIETMLDIIKH